MCALQANLAWDALRGVRSLCRLRAGLVVLCHKNGRVSQARMQYCIGCGDCVTDPYLHAILSCPHWRSARDRVYEFTPRPMRNNRLAMYDLLKASPGDDHFAPLVALCVDIDRVAKVFWELHI